MSPAFPRLWALFHRRPQCSPLLQLPEAAAAPLSVSRLHVLGAVGCGHLPGWPQGTQCTLGSGPPPSAATMSYVVFRNVTFPTSFSPRGKPAMRVPRGLWDCFHGS